jgi:DNA repair protein RAD57
LKLCFLKPFLTISEGNFQTVKDLLLVSTQDIAKRCKSSPLEIKRIMDILLRATPWPALNRLDSSDGAEDEMFTTGDVVLDKALGGGIRTGMVWEVVGERYPSIYS